jgi:hypothetical protein
MDRTELTLAEDLIGKCDLCGFLFPPNRFESESLDIWLFFILLGHHLFI